MLEIKDKIIVGLTGMSGAGKSTVCRCFESCGFDIIDCDLVAREVVQRGSPFLRELSQKLSPQLINGDGTLDRRKTAELIFSDSEKRKIYNSMIFPYITYNVMEKIRMGGRFVLLDAPTLFEARLEGLCTKTVSVVADAETCISRIMARDGITRGHAQSRLMSQRDSGFFRRSTDFCIENNGTEQQLYSAAEKITEQLKGLK